MPLKPEDESLKKQLHKKLRLLSEEHDAIEKQMQKIKDLLTTIDPLGEMTLDLSTLGGKALKAMMDFCEEKQTDRVKIIDLFTFMQEKGMVGFEKINKLRATLSKEANTGKIDAVERGVYSLKK